MVLTHAKVKSLKKQPIYVKEDNPARKFMSKEQAVEDSRRIKEEREKLDAYKDKLKADRETAVAGVGVKVKDETSEAPTPENVAAEQEQRIERNKQEKIIELEAQLETIKGQGSAWKRKKIQAQINELRNS